MTTIKDVENILKRMQGNKTAQQWLHNDIIKHKLATSYDEWQDDHADNPEMQMSLLGHIEYFIDSHEHYPKMFYPGGK